MSISNSKAAMLKFATPPEGGFNTTVLIGKKKILKSMAAAEQKVDEAVLDAMLSSIAGASGSTSTFCSDKTKFTLCQLPEKVSRNNHPLSVHTLTSMLGSACGSGSTNVKVGGVTHPAVVAAAAAKAFPLYSRKSSGNANTSDSNGKETEKNGNDKRKTVTITCFDESGTTALPSTNAEQIVADAVRLSGRLMDMTPEELTTTAFADECRTMLETTFAGKGVTMKEIVGEDLRDQGYGGVWGVGKAAEEPPRMIIMEYTPPQGAVNNETVALVGKGILYDTGGLSLKSRAGMSGMKHDMGGAAGLLGAFSAAVQLQVDRKVTLILCLAENAIGPNAFRNDDILTLYSGKTVEVNNCDAEGRLVLGDGVAHATKHIDGLSLVINMATLTGAQMVATGKKHAAILANKEELEQRAVKAGLLSGDLVYPLLYAPELLRDEFKSVVADMKNSVKDRSNAQASCAGHFVESHLAKDYNGGWLHVDMAGPGSKDQRGTGYGVGLVLALLEAPGFR